MIECLRKYAIDGLHFDYIRYGPHQCYCQHCQEEFARRYGFEPITTSKRKTFPTTAVVSANTLTDPTTATIFAEFSNRTPAIALNKLGKGVVLLLSWHAEHEMPPAVGETVKRAMSQWTSGGQKVDITTTTANRDQYGARSMNAATISLWRLGYRPKVVGAGQPRGTGFQPRRKASCGVKTRPRWPCHKIANNTACAPSKVQGAICTFRSIT